MNYIRSGSCVMEIGGILTSLREGDCILISPGVPPLFYGRDSERLQHRTAGIRLDLPEKMDDEFQFLRGREESLQLSECGSVGGIMEEICRCFREDKPELYMEPQLEFGFGPVIHGAGVHSGGRQEK